MKTHLHHIFLTGCLFARVAFAQQGVVPTWHALPDALNRAANEDRIVLVYVQAAWCGPCQALERETFSDAQVAIRLTHFAGTRLTIDDRDRFHRLGRYRLSEADWAARLGVETTPTLVFMSKDGTVIGRIAGFRSAEQLVPVLDAALSGTGTGHP